MSMTQLVIGTAFGFIVAQALLFGLKRLMRRLRRGGFSPGLPDWRGWAFSAGFIRYAAPLGVSAAVVALGVWSVSDYLAAKSAHSATLATLDDPVVAVPVADSQDTSGDGAAASVAAKDASPEAASDAPDPYKDAEFKVRGRPHRTASLKDTLVQRAETKARNELLKDVQLHVERSQYDCEAADRAGKYLKAGLDVWGFGDWQTKYFPLKGYRGATLEQCQNIKNLIDPSALDLQTTVAQDTHSAAP